MYPHNFPSRKFPLRQKNQHMHTTPSRQKAVRSGQVRKRAWREGKSQGGKEGAKEGEKEARIGGERLGRG